MSGIRDADAPRGGEGPGRRRRGPTAGHGRASSGAGSLAPDATHEGYTFWWGGPFSRWAPCAFGIDGRRFTSTERAMMFEMVRLFGDEATAPKIAAAEEPGRQKALGRLVRGFSDAVWDGREREVVLRVNRAEFGQNRGLRRKLFRTGRTLLVEASPLDAIRGIGPDEATARVTDPEDWPGRNRLGRLLTEVRDEPARIHPEGAAACAP